MKCNVYCMTGHSLKDTCSEPLEGSFFMFVGVEVDSWTKWHTGARRGVWWVPYYVHRGQESHPIKPLPQEDL